MQALGGIQQGFFLFNTQKRLNLVMSIGLRRDWHVPRLGTARPWDGRTVGKGKPIVGQPSNLNVAVLV
jgi:hypothetical protein